MTVIQDVSRQRMDYRDLPNGDVEATLTITFPGGIVKRFTAITTREEAQSVEGEIVGAELALLGPEVGFSFKKMFKGVGKLAKKVASSKVFSLAATGLALAAPLLGPAAPALLGAAAGMGVAAKLAKAGVAAAKGATQIAKQLTAAAATDAHRLTGSPAAAAALLESANKKRLGAEKIADKPRKPPAARPAARPPAARPASRPSAPAAAAAPKVIPCKPCAKAATVPQFPPMTEGDLLARARAGRVRSNTGAPVDTSQLLAAHQQGRIFWVN